MPRHFADELRNPVENAAKAGIQPEDVAPLFRALRAIRDGVPHRSARSMAHAYDLARQIASQALEKTQ